LPPLFVFSVIILSLLSFLFPLAGLVLGSDLFVYFLILFLVGLQVGIRDQKPYILIGLPLAISVMHISWGSGFLWSILKSSNNNNG